MRITRYVSITFLLLCSAANIFGQPRRNRLPNTSQIRKIDFKNRTYPFDNEIEVTVQNGKWEKLNPEQGDFAYFEVTQVAFGDLTGDDKEEALVIASGNNNYGASGWNSAFERHYIFGMDEDHPNIFSTFGNGEIDDLFAPYANECDGRVMRTKSVTIRSRVISLNAETFTPSCNVLRNVLLRVRIDAGRLVLVGKPLRLNKKNRA